MNILSHVQHALNNLSASKLRSFLAVLGILVGTAAVVALISCGQLATEKALEQFKNLGTDLLAISAYKNIPHTPQDGVDSLTSNQWQQIADQIPHVVKIAPYSISYPTLSFNGKVIQGPVIGADEHLANILHINLLEGHFVSFLDSFEHFCVIGYNLAEQIKEFSLDDVVNKQIRIGQSLYTIIGIADYWKESGFFSEDINQAVIIPLGAIRLVSKDAKINNAVLLLQPDTPIDDVIKHIKQIINSQVPKLDVISRSAKQIIASMESQGHIFTLLLAVIGSISLLVGGIGVMNVMLVSVSERKKEIGIRKAVGAKNSDIQSLFLVESVMLSLLGGILGVVLGLIFTLIVAYFSDWTFSIYALPPIAGFLVSAATGIFFGFYPAYRAAKLEPIASLRSE
jgi:putative ABC transport system permease protein